MRKKKFLAFLLAMAMSAACPAAVYADTNTGVTTMENCGAYLFE